MQSQLLLILPCIVKISKSLNQDLVLDSGKTVWGYPIFHSISSVRYPTPTWTVVFASTSAMSASVVVTNNVESFAKTFFILPHMIRVLASTYFYRKKLSINFYNCSIPKKL